MNYENLVSSIFEIDNKIRFAGVYGINGDKIVGGMRKNLTSYLPEDQTLKSARFAITGWQSRKKFYDIVGKEKYSMEEYEKTKRITFPLSDNDVLLVSTEPNADQITIINKILGMLQN